MPGIEVLLVEDNKSDAVLLQEALGQAGIHYNLHLAKDGIMAMEFLLRRGDFLSAPRPSLIILDLNLPRKDGRGVLSEILADTNLSRIPLVVLTSSTTDRDVVTTFGLADGCYMIKPSGFDKYVEVAKAIEEFRRGMEGSSPGRTAGHSIASDPQGASS